MQVTIQQVAIKFAKQLKEAYHSGTDLVSCFKMYLGFLISFCNDPKESKPLGKFTYWQIDDMLMCIHNTKIDVVKQILETFLLYTRRGGKTKNLTIIGVFFSLLGYTVMWRASYTDQLNAARNWFERNPFVIRVVMGSQDNQVRVVNNNEPINFDVIAPGKTQSRYCDLLILDEECLIVTDSAKYDVYEKLRPCLADSKFKHFIHGTTPELNTIAEINYNFLKDQEVRLQTKLVSEHDADDCEWITPEFIENERLLHEDDPYYVDMQYYLKWTVPGGKVFNNVIREGDPAYPMFPLGFLDKIKPTNAGVDFNGDINKHYVGTIAFDDQFIYVLEERTFLDLDVLREYEHLSLELEDGLYNTQFTDDTKIMGLRCIYNLNWQGETHADKKMARVQNLRKRKIIINKAKCPQLWKNLNDCAWNRHKLRTEIVKTKDQHGLDWLLHAMHESEGGIYISQRGQHQKKKRPMYV